MTRIEVDRRLRRHTKWFQWLAGDRDPGRWRLLLYELLVRGPGGLGWAFVLLIPLLGDLVRPWLRRRTACAFLGQLDAHNGEVGCLLHPNRWHGRDVRRQAAFSLWRGFGCGDAAWQCLTAWRWLRAGRRSREEFLRQVEGLDWFDYGDACSKDSFLRGR